MKNTYTFIKRFAVLTAAFAIGLVGCTKEYHEHFYGSQEPSVININIDNNQDLSNNIVIDNSSNVESIIENANENWQEAISEAQANPEINIDATLEAYLSSLAHIGDNNGDGYINEDDIENPVRTGFGFVTGSFDISSGGASSKVGSVYNKEYGWRSNLNNWLKAVTPDVMTAAIGDFDMGPDDRDYPHKMDTTSRTFYIYDASFNLGDVTSGSVSAVSFDVTPKDLYENNVPDVILEEGNYKYFYEVEADTDGIMAYLPFKLEGEFRAYGQNYTIPLVAQTDWSYFTIDKAASGNGSLASTPVQIGANIASPTFENLSEETGVTIHHDGTDYYEGDMYYVYVSPSSNYQFKFYYEDADGNVIPFINTTNGIVKNVHYHVTLNINISDKADGSFDTLITFPDFGWEEVEVNILHGGINLREVFFDNNPATGTVSASGWDTSWAEVWNVKADFDGTSTVTGTGIDTWHRGTEECGYMVTDGQTPMQNITVFSNDGTFIAQFRNVIGGNRGETRMIANALNAIQNNCASYGSTAPSVTVPADLTLAPLTDYVYTFDITDLEGDVEIVKFLINGSYAWSIWDAATNSVLPLPSDTTINGKTDGVSNTYQVVVEDALGNVTYSRETRIEWVASTTPSTTTTPAVTYNFSAPADPGTATLVGEARGSYAVGDIIVQPETTSGEVWRDGFNPKLTVGKYVRVVITSANGSAATNTVLKVVRDATFSSGKSLEVMQGNVTFANVSDPEFEIHEIVGPI